MSGERIARKSFELIARRLPVILKMNGYDSEVMTRSQLSSAGFRAIGTHSLLLQPMTTRWSSGSAGGSHSSISIKADMSEITAGRIIWTGRISFADSTLAKFDDEAGDQFSKKLLIALRDAKILNFTGAEAATPIKK